MKVNIDDIQKITSLLLTKLKESIGNEIDIQQDYYWDILDNEMYNPYEEPKNLTLGQLSDDIKDIQRLNKSDDAVVYDLRRISGILKVLYMERPTAF